MNFKNMAYSILFFCYYANAQQSGNQLVNNHPSSVVVSSIEKAEYYKNKDLISEQASRCLTNTWNTHLDFFKKYKISKYYGDRNPNLDTRAERLSVIREVGASDAIIDQLEGISCIGLTRKCLKQAITATNSSILENLWSRIDKNVIANGTRGDVLIQHLQKLGWKILYWNPAPELNTQWDKEDPKLTIGKPVNWDSSVKNAAGQPIYNPAWGMHEARYKTVMARDSYMGIKIDDKKTLVGFKDQAPKSFSDVSFFIGIAHAGYHVFPGFNGQVIEAHSMRKLNSIDNLEIGEFNPLAKGGSPKWTNIEKYRSGIIAIPPM